jgi:uncharacterized protein YbjT (DUF2867 family)
MKILLTGATGYIGRRLLPVLLEQGHQVICVVRDKARLDLKKYKPDQVSLVEADLENAESLSHLPKDIEAAYYLVHSMSGQNFVSREKDSAENFVEYLSSTSAKQVVYLSGITNSEELSKHLRSRQAVENILTQSEVPLTTLRAGIIVGSGSASFEIIRDLVEKLPVMITPKWLKTKCQPISIRNVIQFLTGVLGIDHTFGKSYDICGPDTLTYQQMLEQFAEVRNLKRKIFIVPVMTPRLSSYWLYFVTSTSYELAKNLVNSMRIDVVGKTNTLAQELKIALISYKEAIRMAFDKIEQNLVLSSWNDSGSPIFRGGLSRLVEVPKFGVLANSQSEKTPDPAQALQRIFSIGGRSGWYYADWLWSFRGFIDRAFGGVGLRRGRKNAQDIGPGDALDFWRVIYSNKDEKRLVLYAEMKLPGEAWLEFKIDKDNNVHQTATFRPLGLGGRLYWMAMLPFHYFIFRGMLHHIAAG